jgi:hypothetical protein
VQILRWRQTDDRKGGVLPSLRLLRKRNTRLKRLMDGKWRGGSSKFAGINFKDRHRNLPRNSHPQIYRRRKCCMFNYLLRKRLVRATMSPLRNNPRRKQLGNRNSFLGVYIRYRRFPLPLHSNHLQRCPWEHHTRHSDSMDNLTTQRRHQDNRKSRKLESTPMSSSTGITNQTTALPNSPNSSIFRN